ncbi:MAG: hypothetical protein WD826_12660 [Actinomycetota bacterium]
MGSRKKLVSVLAVALCLATALGGPADAAKRNTPKVPSQVRIRQITDSQISGTVSSPRRACESGRQVTLTINGEEIGTIDAEDTGEWTTEVTVEDGDVVRANIDKLIVGRKGKKAVCKSDSDTKTANIPEPTVHEIVVEVSGSGGRIDSTPSGINNCRESAGVCTNDFNRDGEVTLTATVDAGQQFTGWGGACTGTATTCSLTMDGDKAVTAAFAPSGGGGEPDTCPVPTDIPDPIRGVFCTVADLLSS